MKRNFILLTTSLILLSCGNQQAKNTGNEKTSIGGSDAAMGYAYSKVLDKKIRIFEKGTRMLSAIDPQAAMATFAVFPPDSSKVELFLPEETIVLEKRTRSDGTSVWNIEDDDTYMLERYYDEWIVTRRGKVLFSSTGFENIHKTMFVNDKGEILSAAFFTKAGVAQINYVGVDHVLYQYITGSGYGYRNSFVEIRGKGKDMTLFFSGDNKSIHFIEQE